MRSRFEKFIDDHRADFDGEEPSPLVWQNINRNLAQKPKPKVITLPLARVVAAAAVIIILAGVGYLYITNQSRNGELAVTRPGAVDLKTDQIIKEINPDYLREVNHFTQLIELKQNELQQIKIAEPELYNTFLADISKLDSSYNALQRQLPQNPNREQLLEAMIQNLRLQTDLLNQQLLIIQKIKNFKSTKDENSKGI